MFTLRSLQLKTKASEDIIRDFLFALNADTKANMQRSADKFSNACTNLGLTISSKKVLIARQCTVYRRLVRKLNHFHTTNLRNILGYK